MKKNIIIILFVLLLFLNIVNSIEDTKEVIVINKVDNIEKKSIEKNKLMNVKANLNKIKIKHQYKNIDAYSATVDKETYEELLNDPNIEVYENKLYSLFLDNSRPQINADKVHSLIQNNQNITGAGETVCIIDTGVDFNHDNLGNGWGNKIIAGHNTVSDTDCSTDNSACMDTIGHGTHVSGIIISNHSQYKGIAPEANIAIVKACTVDGCYEDDVTAGIEWCVTNSNLYNISAISMSLGSAELYDDYCDDYAPLDALQIDQAVANNISVFIASGNNGSTTKISAPACVQNATSVGGVNDLDNIIYNRGPILDLLAPAVSIYSLKPNNDFQYLSGTSMSTPHAAASAALLLQYKKLENNYLLTPDEIKETLKNTGLNTTGYPRIDVFAAINYLDNRSPNVTIFSNTSNTSSLFFDITSDEVISYAFTEIDVINYTMNCSALTCNLTLNLTAPQNYRIYVNDSANNFFVSDIFNFNNSAPNIISFLPNSSNISINEGNSILFSINASDPDNNSLFYYFYINNNLITTNQTYNFTANFTSTGLYNISYYVSDNILNNSVNWTLEINNSNAAPVFLENISNINIEKNNNYTLNLSEYFIDYDLDNLTYNATTGNNISLFFIENNLTIVPDLDYIGSSYLIINTSDGINWTQSNNFTITIENPPAPQPQNTGGGGGGGGRSTPKCYPSWTCLRWSQCSMINKQRCLQWIDVNNCNKAHEGSNQRDCTYIAPPEPEIEKEEETIENQTKQFDLESTLLESKQIPLEQKDEAKNQITGNVVFIDNLIKNKQYAIYFIVLLLIVGGILLITKRKKPKRHYKKHHKSHHKKHHRHK